MGKRPSSATWFEIGRRYTIGRESAKFLAREFGVSASAIHKRAARGDWGAPDDVAQQPKGIDIHAVVERLECIANRLDTRFPLEAAHEV